MTRINGKDCPPETIDVPEYGRVGDTRLLRAAMSVWLIGRGQPACLNALGNKAHALAEERKRKRRAKKELT